MELRKPGPRERLYPLSSSTARPDALWFVTKPTDLSEEPQDVMFKIETWRDLKWQFDGGLDPDDIIDTFESEELAKAKALAILAGGTAAYGTRS